MKTTTAIKFVVMFVLGFLAGWCVNNFHASQPREITVVIPDSIVKKEQTYIDSLRTIEERIENKRMSLKDSIQVIVKWKTEEIDNVKNLPIDSGILFLKNKLREYED